MAVKFAFNDMTLSLWVLLRQTYISLLKCEEVVIGKTGITLTQYYVLLSIKYLKSPASQADVARWLDRKANSITTIIDRMEKDDLVKRLRNPKDRRSLQLIITDKGKDALSRATKPAMITMKKLVSCLSDEEMATLIQLMEKLRKAAYKELSPGEPVEELKVDTAKKIANLLSDG